MSAEALPYRQRTGVVGGLGGRVEEERQRVDERIKRSRDRHAGSYRIIRFSVWKRQVCRRNISSDTARQFESAQPNIAHRDGPITRHLHISLSVPLIAIRTAVIIAFDGGDELLSGAEVRGTRKARIDSGLKKL